MLTIIIVFYVVCFREWYYEFWKPYLGDVVNQITLSKVDNMKKRKEKWLYDKRKKTVLSKSVFFTFSELLHFGRPGRLLLVKINIALHNMNSHALFTYRAVDKPNTTIVIKTLYTTRGDSWNMVIKHYRGGRCVFVGQIWIVHLPLFTVK